MPAQLPEREISLRRVRQVIGHLVRDGTAVARLDGSVHTLFPVAVGAAEGAAIRSCIARAASFFLTNLGWSLEQVSTAEDRHHWAVLRTGAKPDTRPFDYFADF